MKNADTIFQTDFKMMRRRGVRSYIELEKAKAGGSRNFDTANPDQKRNLVKVAQLSKRQIDFSNKDLAGVDLRGIDLAKANLRGANLRDAKISDANGANFAGANLSGADMRYARLTGARLDGALMGGTDAEGANLRYASKNGSLSWGCNFNFIEADNLQSCNTVSIGDHHYAAQLTCATISGLQIAGNFNGVAASNASFAGNFSFTSMNHADLKHSELAVRGQHIELTAAELDDAKVGHNIAREAELTGAKLGNAHIDNKDVATRVAAETMEKAVPEAFAYKPRGRVARYEELRRMAGVDTAPAPHADLVPERQVRQIARKFGMHLAA